MIKIAKKPIFLRQLPLFIILIGIVLAFSLWFHLVTNPLSDSFVKYALPWITLIACLAIVVLSTTIAYLYQLLKERKATRTFLANEAKKELAERLKVEQTKQKLEIALLQGQKLQAIGTLAGGIAHDFNNLLYAIKGFTEMAREDIEENTLIHKNLGRVLEAAQRAQDLVARILAFGRREQAFEMSPIHIQSIIEGILGLLIPTIPASVTIHFEGLTKDCLVMGNQTQLHQVIVNIIINAVDAMEGEGTITIKLSHILANDDYLKQFPDIKNTTYCRIEISDTGHGMDNSTLERIFEPFYTTKEVGKGTGLGLAMVHSIINQHQGKITVSSQLGRGTMFTILLPEESAPLATPNGARNKKEIKT